MKVNYSIPAYKGVVNRALYLLIFFLVLYMPIEYVLDRFLVQTAENDVDHSFYMTIKLLFSLFYVLGVVPLVIRGLGFTYRYYNFRRKGEEGIFRLTDDKTKLEYKSPTDRKPRTIPFTNIKNISIEEQRERGYVTVKVDYVHSSLLLKGITESQRFYFTGKTKREAEELLKKGLMATEFHIEIQKIGE